MQSSNFIYKKEDETVARANLQLMIQDLGTQDVVGIGSNNSGWCYAFAPLRQFLADPRFIRLLRKYKEHYYHNGKLQPNKEFLEAMYGSNYTTEHVINVFHILNSLCKHTDADGKLLPVHGQDKTYDYSFNTEVTNLETGERKQQTIYKHVNSPYAYLIKLVHTIFPEKKQDDPGVMYNYLSDCTAIMSESPHILSYSTTEQIYANQKVNLSEMREDLDSGLCITASANGGHTVNIYKAQEHNYRLIGSTPHTGLSFSHLIDAIAAIHPNAAQPENQQYWLCAKITELQVDNGKKAGIET